MVERVAQLTDVACVFMFSDLYGVSAYKPILWNLSIMDIIGTKIFVLISEVSLFQGENNTYAYKVGTRSSVLTNRCPNHRGVL